MRAGLIAAAILSCLVVGTEAHELPTAEPEDVGMSSERLDRLTATIDEAIESDEIAGAVTLVSRRGKVVYFRAAGMMDQEAAKPMQRDTIFRIASMTKPITSVAAMMLLEEGRLLLTDPISKYIPEFKDPEVLVVDDADVEPDDSKTVPAKTEITVRHLLTHTSGIGYGFDKHLARIYREARLSGPRDEETVGEMTRRLARLPLRHHPGEKFHYGLSTDVLGHLVEVVSGMPLDEFFGKRVFLPLGMRDSYFFLPQDKVQRLAAAYEFKTGERLRRVPEGMFDLVFGESTMEVNVDFPYAGSRRHFSGGSGLCSTVPDYWRFCQMVLNGGEMNGERLLSRKTVELMLTKQNEGVEVSTGSAVQHRQGFGLGFAILTDPALDSSLASPGTCYFGGAYMTLCGIDPREHLVYVFMTQIMWSEQPEIGRKIPLLVFQAIDD